MSIIFKSFCVLNRCAVTFTHITLIRNRREGKKINTNETNIYTLLPITAIRVHSTATQDRRCVTIYNSTLSRFFTHTRQICRKARAREWNKSAGERHDTQSNGMWSHWMFIISKLLKLFIYLSISHKRTEPR